VLKRPHLLLVTLLLVNAAAMEALPIFLDRVVSPTAAIILSVTAVLFFGAPFSTLAPYLAGLEYLRIISPSAGQADSRKPACRMLSDQNPRSAASLVYTGTAKPLACQHPTHNIFGRHVSIQLRRAAVRGALQARSSRRRCAQQCGGQHVSSQIRLCMHAGEIIPQALCTRYGLAIGAYSAWFVWALMWAVGAVSWPVSKVLDYLLGTEHGVRTFLSPILASLTPRITPTTSSDSLLSPPGKRTPTPGLP
jgi:hypothetical protein